MVEYRKVSKTYADGTTAVDGLDLHIERGELVVLIGPSGCGKTTMLKMTNRLADPTDGTIIIDGEDIAGVDPVRLRRGIGYVIQETGLMPHLTVAENIATVPHLLRWERKRIRARVDELLEMAGLDPGIYRYRLPSQLSGGQRQRIGVLRGLAAEPDVVLMDEPFGALDPISREKLQAELLDLQTKLRKTILFVTHDIDEAFKLGDRVALMRRGRIEQLGTPADLQNEPVNEFVRNFIGEDRLANISPDVSVEFLIEEAPLKAAPDDPASGVLEAMEDVGRDTVQIVDRNGVWRGMGFLPDMKRASSDGGTARDAARLHRKLFIDDATVRDAAEMLADQELPIPVLDGKNRLLGLVTDSGIARMTIARLTRRSAQEAR